MLNLQRHFNAFRYTEMQAVIVLHQHRCLQRSESEPLPTSLDFCCSGGSGFVLLCQDMQTLQQVAIKFLARGPGFKTATVRHELANQRLCMWVGGSNPRPHPHIVQLLVRNFGQTREDEDAKLRASSCHICAFQPAGPLC